jgi:RimJ/RimL family protein N-acetyltransferase
MMHFPILHTERLTLRPFTTDDWGELLAYTANPQVMCYIAPPFDEVQARTFVARHSSDEAEAAAVVLASEERLIGHIVFHPWFAPQTFEIGWVFHPDYHKRGYATEAAWALLDYGFTQMGLHRVIATCQPENPASAHVMEKLGMRREGHFRQCISREGGVWWDEYFYAILRAEWPAGSPARGE